MSDIIASLERSAMMLEDISDITVLRDFTVGSGLYELQGALKKAALNQRRAAEYIALYKTALGAVEEARSELLREITNNGSK
jgi:hypothetical protein